MDSIDRVFASSVKRDLFQYEPYRGLQVHHIPRSSSSRLYELITWKDTGPVLRKDGKPRVHQPPKHRDESNEFYHAQCVHYGLKPLKTKAAAKKELLKALEANGRNLPVPQRILDLEKELKVEFAAANEVAKKKYEEEKKQRLEAERARDVKRKREDDELQQEIIAAAARGTSQKSKILKPQPLDLTNVAGRYAVVSPYLRDNYGSARHGRYTLALAPSRSGTVFGAFHFGAFKGYLRSTTVDNRTRTIKFHWRGRETGEGESTFGDENRMRITFVDDKTFEGDAEGDFFSSCEIMGKREGNVGEKGNYEMAAMTWSDQYDELDEENYERERVGRWH